ncbi:MAG: esterase/lipase family protein [Roseimicrobium sp.]
MESVSTAALPAAFVVLGRMRPVEVCPRPDLADGANSGMARHVVLVHGLRRTGGDMRLLAARLRAFLPGTRTHIFEYASRQLTTREAGERLCGFVDAVSGGEPVSFVGHSLGGLLVRALDASEGCSVPLHRLVTLGTPHGGAIFARRLARHRLARALYGPVLHELGSPSLPAQPRQLEIGCLIGGTHSRCGFCPIFGADNDGMVLAQEADLPAGRARQKLIMFHALFPLSKQVAQLAAAFLATGDFTR